MRLRSKMASMFVAGALCFTATPAQVIASQAAATDAAIVAQDGAGITNAFTYTTKDITGGSWTRLGGANRYETMALVDKDTFERSDWAVIATGESFPDALCANALAGTLKCPVLLTTANNLSAEARSEIERLGVKNVYIVGSTGTVSTNVESTLSEMGVKATRIAGGSDQEMSIKVFEACRAAGSPSQAVIIATGTTFADALSIGPWSYSSGTPIMLTDGSHTLTEAQVAAIKADKLVKEVIVIGGPAAVSDDVAAQLAPEIAGTRIGGANRYETSAKVADWSVNNGGLSWKAPLVTSGKNFPDSLAGAALAAKNGSVLLVADATSDESIVRLRKHQSSVQGGYVLGGKDAMPIDNPLVDTAPATDANKKTDSSSTTKKNNDDEVFYYSDSDDDDEPFDAPDNSRYFEDDAWDGNALLV